MNEQPDALLHLLYFVMSANKKGFLIKSQHHWKSNRDIHRARQAPLCKGIHKKR